MWRGRDELIKMKLIDNIYQSNLLFSLWKNDWPVCWIFLYLDFFDDIMYVKIKFTPFFISSTLKNTICFRVYAGRTVAINIIAGRDRKYIPPMKAKLAKKLISPAFFLFSRKIFTMPIAKTITVTILKNTNRQDGIVSYIWYLSESPSFIFPSRVRIKFISPNIETKNITTFTQRNIQIKLGIFCEGQCPSICYKDQQRCQDRLRYRMKQQIHKVKKTIVLTFPQVNQKPPIIKKQGDEVEGQSNKKYQFGPISLLSNLHVFRSFTDVPHDCSQYQKEGKHKLGDMLIITMIIVPIFHLQVNVQFGLFPQIFIDKLFLTIFNNKMIIS